MKRTMQLGNHWPLMRFSSLQGDGPIYFTPVGRIAPGVLDDLTKYYREKLKLNCKILPQTPIPPAALNHERRQVEDGALISELKIRYPRQAKTCVIGITSEDLYSREMDWQFAFSTRSGRLGGPNVAIVSIARLDPLFFRTPPDRELTQARTRKMVTKNIGILYFGLEPSPIQRSVLFTTILSLKDLDRMGQGF